MSKFKRKKSKRTVKCTLCTKHRWLGNNKGRTKDKEADHKKRSDKEIKKFKG
jgi:hypothetical protein